ncbi:Pre-mRNA-splicing factor SPF27 [Naviculisporaceae sp. PSN 640]
MPSITTVHESLPYVDEEPTPAAREAALALISAERSLVPDDPHHALLPPPVPEITSSRYLTPLLQSELSRLASSPDPSKSKLSALDLSRYEALEPPTLPANSTPSEKLAILSEALSRAYTLNAYLSQRRQHLALLDSYGKNAWLISNWHLEGELKSLEKELSETKRAIDVLTLQRKSAQDEAGPEILGLEDTWKKAVGRVLETEAATEELRRQVLEARRRAA